MGRIAVLVIWGLVQITLFVLPFFVPAFWAVAYPLLVAVGLVLALMILFDNSKLTTSKLSWITIVLAIPIFGVYLYIIFGLGHMSKYRQKVLENSKMRFTMQKDFLADSSNLSEYQKSIVGYLDKMRYNTAYLHYGGDITCYNYGEEKFNQMFEDIKNAKKYIHLEYYIVKKGILFDRLIELLIEKVKEGVEVRIMSDFVGGRTLGKTERQYLEKNGIKIAFFNELKINVLSKLSNFRDHRKIAVIDGIIAYTGGFNIGDEYIDLDKYYGHWEDFHIRIANSSVVLEYETFFAQTWFYETGEKLFSKKYYPNFDDSEINKDTYIYPYVDGPDSVETFVRDMFVKTIMSATKSIYIATPYFIPDDVLYDALLIQAQSGIDITIITPGLPDKKIVKISTESYYEEMLKVGIKIHEYNGFIHAKKLLIDDETAIVGTANFDMRSFNLSFEACTLLMNGQIIKDIKATFDEEIANSQNVCLTKVSKQPKIKKLMQIVLRLFAPLF